MLSETKNDSKKSKKSKSQKVKKVKKSKSYTKQYSKLIFFLSCQCLSNGVIYVIDR